MKRFGIILLLAVAVTSSVTLWAKPKSKKTKAAKEQVVIVGTEGAYPPYNFVNKKGEADGYDIDVMNAIAERIPGITFKFEPTAWDGIFVALESGKFDIIASQISRNAEREKKYLFADTPYFYGYSVITFKKGRTDIKNTKDLYGKTVTAGVGSYNTTWLEEYNKKNGNPIKVQYNDGNAAVFFKDIADGRVDATLTDPITTDTYAKENNLPLEWVVLDEQETAPAYFLFANNKNGQKYRDLVEKALQEIKADGTLSKISEKWFGKDYSVPPAKN